jgi:hypothetical protein
MELRPVDSRLSVAIARLTPAPRRESRGHQILFPSLAGCLSWSRYPRPAPPADGDELSLSAALNAVVVL